MLVTPHQHLQLSYRHPTERERLMRSLDGPARLPYLTIGVLGARPLAMSMYSASVPQVSQMLSGILGWLDKAEAHAKAKNFDANLLLSMRLVPDMYPLVRQFQSACDTAKFIGARLAGKEAPKHPDTEQTLDEVRARVRSTLEFLSTIQESDFVGAAERKISISYLPADKRMLGAAYLNENALPNFYFHFSMAYAILRHNGVDVGKRDFITKVTLVDA